MGKPVPGTSPIDAADIKKCAGCGKGVMHAGAVHFYELTIVQCVVDYPNIQRMHGLEMMMGGAVPLARLFSPDNTVAHRMDAGKKRRWICSDCSLEWREPVVFMLDDDKEERAAAARAEATEEAHGAD